MFIFWPFLSVLLFEIQHKATEKKSLRDIVYFHVNVIICDMYYDRMVMAITLACFFYFAGAKGSNFFKIASKKKNHI